MTGTSEELFITTHLIIHYMTLNYGPTSVKYEFLF